MLRDAVLSGEEGAARVHIEKERGVLVAVSPINSREDETILASLFVLEELLETVRSAPDVTDFGAALSMGLRGEVSGSFDPPVFIPDSEVKVAEDDTQCRLRGNDAGRDVP